MEQLRKELHKLRSQQYMRNRRRDAQTNLSSFTMQTALLICVILDYDFAAGAAWLLLRSRRGTALADGVDSSQARALLEDQFLKMDVHVVASWTGPVDSPLTSIVKKTAATFARGHRLAEWVRQKNTQGAVVPSRALLEQYNAGVDATLDALAPFSGISSTTAHARVWACRWRRGFGAKHARLRFQAPEPLEETRLKVRRNVSPCLTTKVHRGSKLGSFLTPV